MNGACFQRIAENMAAKRLIEPTPWRRGLRASPPDVRRPFGFVPAHAPALDRAPPFFRSGLQRVREWRCRDWRRSRSPRRRNRLGKSASDLTRAVCTLAARGRGERLPQRAFAHVAALRGFPQRQGHAGVSGVGHRFVSNREIALVLRRTKSARDVRRSVVGDRAALASWLSMPVGRDQDRRAHHKQTKERVKRLSISSSGFSGK